MAISLSVEKYRVLDMLNESVLTIGRQTPGILSDIRIFTICAAEDFGRSRY